MTETQKKVADLSPEARRALLAQLLREKARSQEHEQPLSQNQREKVRSQEYEQPLSQNQQEKVRPQEHWESLSQNQQALWFLAQLAPTSAAYNLLYSASVQKAFAISVLQRALARLAQRYPILTATYGLHDGVPMQRTLSGQAIPLEQVTVEQWSTDEIRAYLLNEANRPVDLEQGPVFRVLMLQRGPEEYILAFIVHHIATDFWALDLLVDELYLLYLAEKSGMQAPLPPPGVQHTEYVRWQQELLASAEGEAHWDYWKDILAGELPVLSLPADHSRPPVQTYRGASHSFSFPASLVQQLKALASQQRVTLFNVLLTAYQVFLYRYTNQEDLIVGTTALGRTRADLERVIDYLANPVLIRADLSATPTFQDLLACTRQAVNGALEHQDYPFPLLVERLQPRRDPSYSPLYQTLFIWDRPRVHGQMPLPASGLDAFGRMLQAEHLLFEPFVYGQQGAPFDLTLTIFEIDGGLTADFRYNVDLFEPSTLARMAQQFIHLVTAIVAEPAQSIQRLPLITDAERQQMLVSWNETQRSYPSTVTLPELFETQARMTPQQVALFYEDQERTYDELNREANQLAHRLQAAGVGTDVLVGVCMERSVEMVVALLAVLKAGGAYVPLDPAYPPTRLAFMLTDAQVPVLLTQTSLRERLPQTDALVIALAPDWQSSAIESQNNPFRKLEPQHLAYMIYTSGSTGQPKGVMNTHRGVCNRLLWMQEEYQLTAEDRVLQKTPFSFDVSVWEFFWPLLSGAALVLARPGGHQEPEYLASLIGERQITTTHFVPSMLRAFLQEPDLSGCSSLCRVICSGEALPFDLQEYFFARFPSGTNLYNLYGPTEAAIDVTAWQCQPSRPVLLGYPIANIQTYILNPALQPVPIGVAGELHLGGVGLARGYHRRPELNREKFISNPFSADPTARLFKTGDLARYHADGTIEFLGRIDYQVKLRGFRIELGEIETTLIKHPAIKEAIVVAHHDASGNMRLVAYVVPMPTLARPSIEELRAALKQSLPDYMVPAVFVFLDAFPLLPNGKVNRKQLPAPDSERPDLQVAYVAPRSQLERQLVEIWQQVLGLDSIGIHDSYFDLGGASIQSLDLIAKAKELDIPLSIEMLFEFQTVAELAAAVELKQREQQLLAVEPQQVLTIARPLEEIEEPSSQPITHANMIIESLGTYLPPRVVDSEELLRNCRNEIRFPLARLTGIQTRRMAGETEFSLDIAKKAVADCLANSSYRPEDIDLLVCGNISRCNQPGFQFTFEPNTAIQLKHHFGFTNALTFDVSNACTGLFTAMYVVKAFLDAGLIRRGMAVSGEYISHLALTAQKEIVDYMDSRLACLTVGDAGAALILEQTENKEIGFHEYDIYTVGHYSEACIGKATDQPHGGAIMYTDAVTVSAVNMKHAISHAGVTLERTQWPTEEIQHVIPHQTSQTTIKDVAREINAYFGREVCRPESVINNIAQRGNTATTTHMVAVMDYILAHRIQSGDHAIFGITGSGATIGTALYTFDDLPDRIRRRVSGTPIQKRTAVEPLTLRPARLHVRIESVGTVPLAGVGPASIKDVSPFVPDNQDVAKQELQDTFRLINIAAENCLAASSHPRQDMNLLVYTGVYRDEYLCEPAVAALVEGKLGINDEVESQQDKKTFAFDLFNSSLGTLDACYTAYAMAQAGTISSALIVASEVENNRGTLSAERAEVAEAGSALIVDVNAQGESGFEHFYFKSFTDHVDALRAHTQVKQGQTVMHFERDAHLEEYMLDAIRLTVQEFLDQEQLALSDIQLVLPPQISSDFIARLSDMLEMDPALCVDVHAPQDLFSSSLPYAFQYVQEHHLARPGMLGLIIAVGSGLQVGCATYRF